MNHTTSTITHIKHYDPMRDFEIQQAIEQLKSQEITSYEAKFLINTALTKTVEENSLEICVVSYREYGNPNVVNHA